jgi:excisionase family DNA binding protein
MERDLPPPAYTVSSLAERWGVSDTFVYEEIEGGGLRYFNLGNKLIRIRPEWVDEYEVVAAS